jgi:hypothetical protein
MTDPADSVNARGRNRGKRHGPGPTTDSKIDAAARGESENRVCTWEDKAPDPFLRAANRARKGVAACRTRSCTPDYAAARS